MTGYVPIHDHPRGPTEYAKLGEALGGALGDRTPAVFYNKIPELWMAPFIENLARQGHTINHSKGDNPQKNSMEYHAVQHQKLEWLERAANEDQEADTFIWMDYGCMALPGFDSNTISDFLGRVRKNDLAIPGCWPKRDIHDNAPCWRFCGTIFIVPRADIKPLNQVFKSVTRIRVRTTKNVSWEVNDLACMELMHVGPMIRWYEADHNARMLTGY